MDDFSSAGFHSSIIVHANRSTASLEIWSGNQRCVVINNIVIKSGGSRDIVIGSGSRVSIVVKADGPTDELVIRSISMGRGSRVTAVISGQFTTAPVVGMISIDSGCQVAFDTSSGSQVLAPVIGNISIDSDSVVSFHTSCGSHSMDPVIGSMGASGSCVSLNSSPGSHPRAPVVGNVSVLGWEGCHIFSSGSQSFFPLIGNIAFDACPASLGHGYPTASLFANRVVVDTRVSWRHAAAAPSSECNTMRGSVASPAGIRAALECSADPRSDGVDPSTGRAAPVLAKRRRSRDADGELGACALGVHVGRHLSMATPEGVHGASPRPVVNGSARTPGTAAHTSRTAGAGAPHAALQALAAEPPIGCRALSGALTRGVDGDGASTLSRPRHRSSSVVHLIDDDEADCDEPVLVSSCAVHRRPPLPSAPSRNSVHPPRSGGSALPSPAVINVKDTHCSDRARDPGNSDGASKSVQNADVIDFTGHESVL